VNVKEFIATGLAAVLADQVQLGSRPTVISAPPSQVAEYPTIAVWIERSTEDYMQPGTILQAADGTPLIGASATDDAGNVLDGTPIILGDAATVSCVGTLHCEGRIWAGSRYQGKREEIEQGVFLAFNQDDSNRGRLMIPLSGCMVGGYRLTFGYAAADISESSWVGEYGFEARLWSWRPFVVDVAMLVPRVGPIAQSLILEFSTDVTTHVSTPSDVTTLTALEKFLVSQGGDATLTTM